MSGAPASMMDEVPTSAADDVFVFPASFAQERLWFLDQFDPGSTVYLLPRSYFFHSPVDVDVLGRSLNEIVRRHEALRTHFMRSGDEVMQVVVPELALALPVIDLRGMPENMREAELWRIAQAEAATPFDLATGPLFRAKLVTLDEAWHALLLTMHHIVSDAWSCDILYRELCALYAAYANGDPSPLSELPVQYADFAQWQREMLTGDVLGGHMDYWRRQLAGAPAVLELPGDRPRGPAQTFNGATISFAIDDDLTARLRALAREENATLFMTLLAVFMTLLHRHSSQVDIVAGSPIANRSRAEIENLIGFFVNTLVLRAKFEGDPSFRQLLRQVREVTLEAYAHQDLPFEKLVQEMRPPRHASHNPLFQVMFVHLVDPASASSQGTTPDSQFISQPLPGAAKFDLTMFVTEAGPRLSGAVEFNTDVFDSERVVRMIGHCRTLLDAVARDPDRPVAQLPMLTGGELAQIRAWNATGRDYGSPVTTPALFEAQAARLPEAEAVVFAGRKLTYSELNARANRLARHLRKLGVAPETRIGICLKRSIDMIVALLGVLKAGGAYVPLDPAYPKDRLAFVIADSQASVVISDGKARDALPPLDVALVLLDDDAAAIAGESAENPAPVIVPDNLAYVIYTSGSTGRPKGVAMAHRPLFNLLQYQVENSRLPDEARTLQFTSPNFDVSFQEMFSTLCGGGTLVMVDDDTRLDPERLLWCIADMRIARLFVPPVMLVQLAHAAPGVRGDLSALRQVIVAGEPLRITPSVVAFFDRLPAAALHNHYGPTETHLATTFTPAGRATSWQELPPIGRPIANSQTYVLDRRLQPLPVGVIGELYVGGAGVARGYLNRPDLTAERFIPDPFSTVPGARLYETGDLVRYTPAGDIECFGRTDEQAKVRGFRVEPGEVRAALQKHPAVRDCAVVLRSDARGDASLVAYLTVHEGDVPTTAELRRLLAATLPDYMVPSNFVFLDELPQLPNGKLDRNALPAPDAARPELGEAFVAPANETEAALADLWSEVLKIARIGIHDNFFDLGGHSLLATQVISRIRERMRIEVPLRKIFEAPTIAELAAIVDELAAKRMTDGLSPSESPAPGNAHPEELLARLEQLSDAEVDALLEGLEQ